MYKVVVACSLVCGAGGFLPPVSEGLRQALHPFFDLCQQTSHFRKKKPRAGARDVLTLKIKGGALCWPARCGFWEVVHSARIGQTVFARTQSVTGEPSEHPPLASQLEVLVSAFVRTPCTRLPGPSLAEASNGGGVSPSRSQSHTHSPAKCCLLSIPTLSSPACSQCRRACRPSPRPLFAARRGPAQSPTPCPGASRWPRARGRPCGLPLLIWPLSEGRGAECFVGQSG